MKLLALFCVCFCLSSCSFGQECNYSYKKTFVCLDRDFGKELDKPELVEIEYFNSKAKKTSTILFANSFISELMIYQLDTISGECIGYTTYDNYGKLLSLSAPQMDTNTMEYLPIRFTSDYRTCDNSPNVIKCTKDRCGNIVEKTIYSSDNPSKVYRKYAYTYGYVNKQ